MNDLQQHAHNIERSMIEDLDRRRVETLARCGLLLRQMQADGLQVYGVAEPQDLGRLTAEVVMALGVEDAEYEEIALEIARDHPEGNALAERFDALACRAARLGEGDGCVDPDWAADWQGDTPSNRPKPQLIAALAKPRPDREAVLIEAVEPWKDFHGDLPEYDHPLRCVFESGVQYTVELLARELGVANWTPCDGTEEFDGDLGGTLVNIVKGSLPTDPDGDHYHPSDIAALLPSERGPQGDLAWFSDNHRLSLDRHSPVYGDDDDQSVEWRVSLESGGINDREWRVVGRGETARDAICAARLALEPPREAPA